MKRRPLTWVMFISAAVVVAVAVHKVRPTHVDAPPTSPSTRACALAPSPPATPVVPPPVVAPQAPEVAAPAPRGVVEVVFALDTTGSMDGMLDGAKRKIWSIVDSISSRPSQPRVRVGLVAYRDKGDEYVTRFWDLSDDIDGVFKHLASLRADGGGDTPEHVAKALYDAVERPSWTQGAREDGASGEQKLARIIYVVGDAPPHTDYDDGYELTAIARKAAHKGIHVNGVRCGDDAETKAAFLAMARAGDGQFMTIAQSGGVAAIESPYDTRLAELSRRLGSTAVFARGHESEGRSKLAAVASAPAATIADRVTFAAKKGVATFDSSDLLVKGAGGVASAKAEDLPADVAAMDPAGRLDWATKKEAERAKVLEEIKVVSRERDAFLRKAEASRSAAARSGSFDDSVRHATSDALAATGL